MGCRLGLWIGDIVDILIAPSFMAVIDSKGYIKGFSPPLQIGQILFGLKPEISVRQIFTELKHRAIVSNT